MVTGAGDFLAINILLDGVFLVRKDLAIPVEVIVEITRGKGANVTITSLR